jgi:di/tricarboxylate transporter
MSPVATTLSILLVAIVAFASNRVPMGIVALGVALLLWATGVVTLEQALAGFGDPTVVFIATLFVVSRSLEATGVTTWVGQRVVGSRSAPGRSLLVVICVLVALLSAVISVNGAVAALIPVVVVVAVRSGLPPSRLLLPLAFSAHAGSLLTLTGSPVNIIVSDAAVAAGARPFGFFEFAIAGAPLVVGSILVITLLGHRLLPDREFPVLPPDLARHARVVRRQYDLPAEAAPLDAGTGAVELMVTPRSSLIGTHLFTGQTTPDGNLVVLGLQRGGTDLVGADVQLQAGDTLLLHGAWDRLADRAAAPELVAVDDPEQLRQAVPFGRGAKRAVSIMAAMVVLLASGALPPVVVGLLAAGAVVLTGVLKPAEAYRAVSWTTIVLIAGMMPLATAFTTTGAADLIARWLLGVGAASSPYLALAALSLLTVVLGQLISNAATVLIMVPIAVSLAADLHVSVLPFLMALAVAGAASFLTPVATPANTMVLEPGGYRFGDYWRLGLPLLALFLVVAIGWVPLFWRF